jgi:hypothetical protein
MQAFASAPRTLVSVLGAVVVILTLQALFFIASPAGLLWPALVAALSLSALFGSRRAAVALKYLLYLMGAAGILSVLVQAMTPAGIVRTLVVAVLLIGVARYLGRSKSVATFYAPKISATNLQG